MKHLSRLAVGALALVGANAFAQSATSCPQLPAASGLQWELLNGSDFVFCKALRQSDGGEAFAVTISRESPFKPSRRYRAEQADIAGQQGYWYRSEIAGDTDAIAREALVEIDAQHVAHVSLRATSEEQKAESMRVIQGLRFESTLLSSK